jgi:hypothetical protein
VGLGAGASRAFGEAVDRTSRTEPEDGFYRKRRGNPSRLACRRVDREDLAPDPGPTSLHGELHVPDVVPTDDAVREGPPPPSDDVASEGEDRPPHAIRSSH